MRFAPYLRICAFVALTLLAMVGAYVLLFVAFYGEMSGW
jgi:hypothetical protein